MGHTFRGTKLLSLLGQAVRTRKCREVFSCMSISFLLRLKITLLIYIKIAKDIQGLKENDYCSHFSRNPYIVWQLDMENVMVWYRLSIFILNFAEHEMDVLKILKWRKIDNILSEIVIHNVNVLSC